MRKDTPKVRHLSSIVSAPCRHQGEVFAEPLVIRQSRLRYNHALGSPRQKV